MHLTCKSTRPCLFKSRLFILLVWIFLENGWKIVLLRSNFWFRWRPSTSAQFYSRKEVFMYLFKAYPVKEVRSTTLLWRFKNTNKPTQTFFLNKHTNLRASLEKNPIYNLKYLPETSIFLDKSNQEPKQNSLQLRNNFCNQLLDKTQSFFAKHY